MKNSFLNTEITFIKGVGPKKAEVLKKVFNILTVADLLHHYPFRYIDRTKIHRVRDVYEGNLEVQLVGKIGQIEDIGSGKGTRARAQFYDDSGSLVLVWFTGISWVKKRINQTDIFVVQGKAQQFGNSFHIAHPDIELYGADNFKGIQPVYHSSESLNKSGLNSRGIERIMQTIVSQMGQEIEETLSKSIIENYGFLPLSEALAQIHFPATFESLKSALNRMKFEELFFLQLQLNRKKLLTKREERGFPFLKVGIYFNSFFNNNLPFALTGAQKRVVKEIRKDLGSGAHMNRLLQGDVGSGKTLVALLTMLLALDNGFQACLVAPTEILAKQHCESLVKFCDGIGINIGLLTGSSKQKERKVLHESLENGSIDILVGTHALLEDKVIFKNLGLAVIDEQHRFGVEQRARFWKKNTSPPHILVMTATPIPRTLAMTFYGDLDVSVIDELPPGRKPIKTDHKFDAARLSVFGFLENEIKKGRQVYIVYPLIDESESLDYKDLMDGYESVLRRFPMPDYNVSIVHGRQKSADKEFEMNRFVNGETQIMVSTTVIEVGVNVPNASVMVIESAEKFGLAQLHQLRGRVGRGAEQSYCILMTGNKLSKEARVRMRTMVSSSDGFEIAEVDMKLRGPGDILGTQQSGVLDLKIADLSKDGQLVQLAKQCAETVLNQDPDLLNIRNYPIRKKLEKLLQQKTDWSKIS